MYQEKYSQHKPAVHAGVQPGLQPRGWRFHPRPLITLIALLGTLFFVGLGFWQLQRAEAKRALVSATAMAGISVTGRWHDGHHVLLDNRVRNGRAGYAVFTPLQLDDGQGTVLVERGWVPLERRDRVPEVGAPHGQAVLRGIAQAPAPARGDAGIETLGAGTLRVQHLDIPALATTLALPLLPYTLRLEQQGSHAQATPPLQPERNIAYAVQWFIFAGIVVALYLGLNLERPPRKD